MVSNPQVSVARCLTVGTGATVGCGLVVAWLLPAVLICDTSTFAGVLVRLCAVVACVAAGWLWVATVVTVLAALRGREQYAVAVPVPASLRRVVLAACGAALTGSLVAVGPAHATPGQQHEDRVARAAAAVAGLPLPDRATAAPASVPVVVVAPGDTLWAIAARALGPGASDAEIDAAWRRIHDLNRAQIGPDPDLIRPAQRLEVLP